MEWGFSVWAHNAEGYGIAKVKGRKGKYTIVDSEGKIIDAVGTREFNSIKEAQDFAKGTSFEGATYRGKDFEVDPPTVERPPAVPLTPEQVARQDWMRQVGLSGEVDSATNIHLYTNRKMTVE